ncbi:MAG: hypothetical protein ACI9T8_000525 [Candidatus Saccharimonadales bacterium]|jgi:hypothetical protein
MDSVLSTIRRLFKDRSGRVVLAQKPNLALTVWAIATIVGKVSANDTILRSANSVAFVAIVIWAIQEIFQGVNYFRKSLGLMILVVNIYFSFS